MGVAKGEVMGSWDSWDPYSNPTKNIKDKHVYALRTHCALG